MLWRSTGVSLMPWQPFSPRSTCSTLNTRNLPVLLWNSYSGKYIFFLSMLHTSAYSYSSSGWQFVKQGRLVHYKMSSSQKRGKNKKILILWHTPYIMTPVWMQLFNGKFYSRVFWNKHGKWPVMGSLTESWCHCHISNLFNLSYTVSLTESLSQLY